MPPAFRSLPAARVPTLTSLSVLIALALGAGAAHAAGPEAPPETVVASGTAAASTLDAVVVTGSRTSNRTVKNSSTPIDVISAEDLASTGQANLLEALQRSLPSLSQIGGYQSDQESLIRGYQLRNLSPGYTLVLVNGKRRNASAYVSGANGGGYPGHAWTDLALIPVSAIDHIEVLRDGASALYGSDAITGVINVILKSNAHGGDVSVESGQSIDGDGTRTSVRANIGLPWGQDGFVSLSGENTRQHHAIRTRRYIDAYLSYPAVDASGNPVALRPNNRLPAGTTPNPAEASRDPEANTILSSPSYALTALAVNAGHGLGENAQFYATATASDRTAQAIQNFRLPATIFGTYKAPSVLNVWPDGFLPVLETKEKQYTGTAGVKGHWGGWDIDGSLTGNRNTVRTYTRHSANFSLAYPGAPTDFYDGKLDYAAGHRQPGPAPWLRRGRLRLAVGGERWRRIPARALRAWGRAVGVVHRLRCGRLRRATPPPMRWRPRATARRCTSVRRPT